MAEKNQIPTVVIFNIAETFVDFLQRSADPNHGADLIKGEAYLGDRALLWGGDPKLSIVSYPIAHADLITSRLNFPETRFIFPQRPSPRLSLDILNEERLVNTIAEYAGETKSLQIIPYATTPELLKLISVLRTQFGLNVITPECPDETHLWIRDLVDTKAGFRQLVSRLLPDADRLLPFGFVCYDAKQAAAAAFWFHQRGKICLVKANTGENGIGIFLLGQNQPATLEQIRERIENDPYYEDDLIVVEECVPATQQISPSLEMFVPHPENGKPRITYLSKQLFLEFGDFCGIEVSKYLYDEPWHSDLERCGLSIANHLQSLGYVGHFDLDCIVSDAGQLYLLEINTRRTGGTHVHDFAHHAIGPDYIEKASLLSYEAMSSGCIKTAEELVYVLGEFLYPMKDAEPYGLIITVTKTLEFHRFGCLTVGRTPEEALRLQKQVANKISLHCS